MNEKIEDPEAVIAITTTTIEITRTVNCLLKQFTAGVG